MIVENEFGKVNIDGQRLSALNITVENIVAECICCTGVDSLHHTQMKTLILILLNIQEV